MHIQTDHNGFSYWQKYVNFQTAALVLIQIRCKLCRHVLQGFNPQGKNVGQTIKRTSGPFVSVTNPCNMHTF